MKISAIQAHIELGNVDANYRHIEELIGQAAHAGADLVVLSELWNTAFYPKNVCDIADRDGMRTKEFLSKLAKEYHVHIVGGSVADMHGEALYNTTYIVDNEGCVVSSYDKVHLFSPGKEDAIFTAGNNLNIFTLDGITMASIICYDVRFSEWVRLAALKGAQILFVPAAWPYPRLSHWKVLCQARAIENQFFVVSVNCCGTSGKLDFCGGSQIIDPWGNVIDSASDEEKILFGDVDFSIVHDIRQSINVFRDRRTDLYEVEEKRGD